MKGTLTKTEQGWVVYWSNPQEYNEPIHLLPLHPDSLTELSIRSDKKLEDRVGQEVEFEIVTYNKKGSSYNDLPYDTYAKLTNQVPDVNEMVEDDVEKLAIHYSTQMEDVSDKLGKYLVKAVYIDGYNKAKETLYTEEQVKLAITLAKDSDYNSTKEIIQSLKQH